VDFAVVIVDGIPTKSSRANISSMLLSETPVGVPILALTSNLDRMVMLELMGWLASLHTS